MYIYWREWDRREKLMTREEARQMASDFRLWVNRVVEERREIEKLARRIEKAAGL